MQSCFGDRLILLIPACFLLSPEKMDLFLHLMHASPFNLQSLKVADKLRVKAEKEKVARSLELLNFLLKTVTQQVRVGLILCALCSVTH